MNKITLGIPTLNRFDSFLKNNLEKYLQNKLIDEIVIVDENGQDYEKINYYFDHEKIKVFKNEKILGPFLNKLEVLKKSKNDWVALIDSDNFAEENYFKSFYMDTFYNQSEKRIKESIPVFLQEIFDVSTPFSKSDLDMITEMYKLMEKNIE